MIRAIVALTAVVVVCACDALAQTEPMRAVWVTRWDYRSPADVDRVISELASLGTTDVIWQVRGQADAFYESDLEPWGRELFRDLPEGASGPGFDPLERAIRRAHEKGMRLHAWVNVMPLWKGVTPPPDRAHPLVAHPAWRLRDNSGKPQALNDHYVIVNPTLPEVQNHLVSVMTDIVTRYDVDGLHLDYIRFVSDTMDSDSSYLPAPRDAVRDSITTIVRRIGTESVTRRDGVMYTAAVWRDPTIARERYLQDAARWANDGTLDLVMPMIYTEDRAAFNRDLDAWGAVVDRRLIVPGIGAYKHSGGETLLQVHESVGCAGVAMFAYSAMFESVDPNQDKSKKAVAERADRRDNVRGAMGVAGGRGRP